MAARLAMERPDYLMHMGQLDPARLSARVLDALQPFYFSDDVAPGDPGRGRPPPRRASRRARCSTCRCACTGSCRSAAASPVLVLGAEGDRICTPDEVQATARHHGVEPVIVPGLAHMMMLERQWERAARALAAWLATL